MDATETPALQPQYVLESSPSGERERKREKETESDRKESTPGSPCFCPFLLSLAPLAHSLSLLVDRPTRQLKHFAEDNCELGQLTGSKEEPNQGEQDRGINHDYFLY